MNSTVVSSLAEQRRQQTDLRLEELQAAHRLQFQVGEHRPQTTKNTWSGKQKEFLDWNVCKGYQNDLINEGKFLLFLHEVKDRRPYKRGRKRSSIALSRTSEPENCRPDHLGWHTLDGYVNAVMDLWRLQHMLGRYPPEFPIPARPPSVKEFLKSSKKDVMDRENAMFLDRGIGTLADEISAHEFGELAKHYWKLDSEEGLKQRTDYLLSFALTCRGDNLRRLKLSEIGHKFFPGEGVSGAHLLRTVWRRSKKNQFGKVQQNALMRHSSVSLCPFGSLSLYFFFRFQVRGDPWPDLSEASRWYNLFVLPNGIHSDKPMTYTKQYEAIKAAQASLGLAITTKTQMGRKGGASMAENLGASEASVDKNGHWQVRSRGGAYTNNVIPWECVRVLAGFSADPKQYYLPRALLDPPEHLRKLVFPGLEASQQQVASLLSSGVRKTEIAGQSFLSLLDHMRTVILQDSAILIADEDHSSHAIWQHPIFSSEAFTTFAAELSGKISSTVTPSTIEVLRALPAVGGHLCELVHASAVHSRSISCLDQKFDQKIQQVNEDMNKNLLMIRNECLQVMASTLTGLGNCMSTQVGFDASADAVAVASRPSESLHFDTNGNADYIIEPAAIVPDPVVVVPFRMNKLEGM
uniref:Ndc10 domain-containing protein n=1 Tax=Spongospora subterranea TaxID=70186 RepID=A0A0H5R2B3_9EUKA|eukprot:CRZ08052.1 hypothetical protein [Spongospora subterranea]